MSECRGIAGARCLWTAILSLAVGCGDTGTEAEEEKSVPREGRYGIYALRLSTQDVSLIHSSSSQVFTSSLSLNSRGDTLVFAQAMDCPDNACMEIAVVGVGGGGIRRVTSNQFWDLYPVWSPDDRQIAFLSWREADLDVHVMNADGTAARRLYDSGNHDADVHWSGDLIVFTSGCRIWSMNPDGTSPRVMTNSPRACQWGTANLPFGDYDPRSAMRLSSHGMTRRCTSSASGGSESPKEDHMICRIWHGWTTPENAAAYEQLLRSEIFAGIAHRGISGYRGIQLLRREDGQDVEFITLMWFDDLTAVREFAGEDHEVAVVPAAARAVLSRFDQRSAHYPVIVPGPLSDATTGVSPGTEAEHS